MLGIDAAIPTSTDLVAPVAIIGNGPDGGKGAGFGAGKAP